MDGTGDGVLRTDAGLEVDWPPDGVGLPVEGESFGIDEFPFWAGSALPLELEALVSSWFLRERCGLFCDCNLIPSVIELTRDACECDMFSLLIRRS